MSEVKIYVTKEEIISNYQLQIDALKTQLDEYKAALEFYGEKETYRRFEDLGSEPIYLSDFLKVDFAKIVADCGKRARDILKKYEGK